MADARIDAVVDAIATHHAAPEALLAWAAEHLEIFDGPFVDELERFALDLRAPGALLHDRRRHPDDLDVNDVVNALFLPGDVRVQLLIFELLAFVTGHRGDPRRQAEILSHWAGRLRELGVLDDAYDRYEDVLEIVRAHALGDAKESDVLQRLADILLAAGLARRAIRVLEEELAIDERRSDPLLSAQTTGNLAQAWEACGEPERALELHYAAIERIRACDTERDETLSAYRLLDGLDVPATLGLELLNTGLTLERLGRDADAMQVFKDSVAEFERTPFGPQTPRARIVALLAVARVARRLGRGEEAKDAALHASFRAHAGGFDDLWREAMELSTRDQ